jgi:transposase
MAYSQKKRQQILQAVDQDMPRAEITKLFQVSYSTIHRYLKRRHETGDVTSKPIPGRTPRKGAALRVGLREQLEAYPDITLEERCLLWEAEHGVKVSMATVSRTIRRLGWIHKRELPDKQPQVQQDDLSSSATSPAGIKTSAAAKAYHLTRSYLARLARTGMVKAYKIDGDWIFDEVSLRSYLTTPRKPGPKQRRSLIESFKA